MPKKMNREMYVLNSPVGWVITHPSLSTSQEKMGNKLPILPGSTDLSHYIIKAPSFFDGAFYIYLSSAYPQAAFIAFCIRR